MTHIKHKVSKVSFGFSHILGDRRGWRRCDDPGEGEDPRITFLLFNTFKRCVRVPSFLPSCARRIVCYAKGSRPDLSLRRDQTVGGGGGLCTAVVQWGRTSTSTSLTTFHVGVKRVGDEGMEVPEG